MIGRKIEVGVGKETVRGTAVAATYWVPKYEVSLDDKTEYVDDIQTLGSIVDSDGSELEKEWAEGEVDGKVRLNSFGIWLLGTFGSVTTTTLATGVYQHVFGLLESNTHPSLTVTVKDTVNGARAYALAMVESLKMKIELGKFVEYTVALKSKKSSATTATPAYTAETEFRARHTSLKLADTLAGLDAATAVAKVASVELSFDKNTQEIMGLGSSQPVDIQNLEFSAELNIEVEYFDTATFRDVSLTGAKKAVRIEITDTTKVIGASVIAPSIVFDFAKVSFQSWERDGGAGDIIKQSIKAKAHFSIVDGKMVNVTVKNAVASY